MNIFKYRITELRVLVLLILCCGTEMVYLRAASLSLESLRFTIMGDIYGDPGQTNHGSGQHWVNTVVVGRPVWCYKEAVPECNLQIKFPANPQSYTIEVVGTTDYGIVFQSGQHPVQASAVDFVNGVNTKILNGTSITNCVYAYKNFNTRWWYHVWDEALGQWGTWIYLNMSRVPIYVTIDPIYMSDFLPYITIAELACKRMGATTKQAALSDSWLSFANRGVLNGYNNTLYYYYPGTTFYSVRGSYSVDHLLVDRNEPCRPWTLLLRHVYAFHGINSLPVGVIPSEGDGFIIMKEWSILAQTGTYPYPMNARTGLIPITNPMLTLFEMVPIPDNYLDLQSLSGTPGQNTPTPSQKVFGLHNILFVDPNIDMYFYDPSYGRTVANENDFCTKVFGFGGSLLSEFIQPNYYRYTMPCRTSNPEYGAVYFNY